MTDEIYFHDATHLATLIRTKQLSPVEAVQSHLDRIEAINPKINAIATLADNALEQARQAEAAAVKGEIHGPLHGVPVTAKDVFDTAGVRTTRGSLIFSDLVPETDATPVARLKSAGAILIGKTNTPEFALRAETTNRVFDRTLHPYDGDRTCGGSSGGEAAAIAAGLSPLGIGTDLGGSNRLPSHYCGVVGLKATHGRIPLTGSWPELMCRHMHVGPLCRTVRDAALALEVMSGPDNDDPFATPAPWSRPEPCSSDISGLRVGFFQVGPFAPVDPQIQEAVERAAAALEERGARVEPVDFDWQDRLAIDVCMDMVVGEGEHYLRPFIAGREDELSESIAGLLSLPLPPLEDFPDQHGQARPARPGHGPVLREQRHPALPLLPLPRPRSRGYGATDRRPGGRPRSRGQHNRHLRHDRIAGDFGPFRQQQRGTPHRRAGGRRPLQRTSDVSRRHCPGRGRRADPTRNLTVNETTGSGSGRGSPTRQHPLTPRSWEDPRFVRAQQLLGDDEIGYLDQPFVGER